MSPGELLPVTIQGFQVATARIEEVSDGKVYIRIPETVAVLGYRIELDSPEPEVEHLVIGPAE